VIRRTLLHPKAVAALFQVSLRTLSRWRVTGKGPRYVKLQSGGIRYDLSEIEDEISSRVRCSTSDPGEVRATS
jgi:predicted site-specific integrase-resolvase